MFQISEPALEVLKEALMAARTGDDQILRIEAKEDGFSLGLDEPHDGDMRFETQGQLVVTAGEDVAQLLEDSKIDVETVDGQPRLYLAT
jgi:hypothetical protein